MALITLSALLEIGLVLSFFYVLGYVIYNLYFHPLRNFPGPFWARASLLWRIARSTDGKFHRHIELCHRKYGDVFRVSPNELSFCHPEAWTEIYGPNNKGVAKIPKAEFYDAFGASFTVQSLGTERDPVLALQKRSLFTSALTPRALGSQEPVLQKNIDVFVEKLGVRRNVDMAKWFIYVGFDIIGEMAFGDSFGCIDREESHPWLDAMLSGLRFVTIVDNLRRYPFLVKMVQFLPTSLKSGFLEVMVQFAREKTAARLEVEDTRNDFLDGVVQKVRDGTVSKAEMEAHSWNMAMAGGETTGSTMASVLYFVLRNPDVHAKLQAEVRSAFISYDEINLTSSMQLEYVMAVLKEGSRIFPTVPQGPPRLSPGVTVAGHYVPEGTEIYVSPWAVTHDERFWDEPYAFRPERWIDPNCTDVKSASQPFSLGPRVCPGKLFATGQMALQLVKMFYTYDMELLDKDLDWMRACRMHFLWWKPKLNVRFIRREI
ncbi:putative cytochrome P450 [Xylariaceae sp. FL0255]|nr:putative cytochrome P450 [Xylariaceae sp. FL0255]